MNDDFPSNTTTPGLVEINSSINGNIDVANDEDWFSVTLTAGRLYTFNLDTATNNGLVDTYLNLYAPNGAFIFSNDDSNNSLASEINFIPIQTNTYFLGAAGYSTATGAYQLTATERSRDDDYSNTTNTNGQLSANSYITGSIEQVGDNDWFAIDLNANQNYTFNLDTLATNGLIDPLLNLYDGDGTLITRNDDSNGSLASEINFTANSSGTFYLGASGFSTNTGNYQLSAQINTTNTTNTATVSTFDIEIDFNGNEIYASAFTRAAERWESIITSDLTDVQTFNGRIDDLRITATVMDIDGPGHVLGQAAPTGIRSNGLPFAGIMQFDSADIDNMIANGTYDGVILHEMGHVLGISNWFFDRLDLLNPNNEFQYTGENGVEAFRTVSDNASANFIPLEQNGGRGTAGSHFDEALFDTELMTGFVDSSMQLSIVTVGVLEDIGYSVNYQAADPFFLA